MNLLYDLRDWFYECDRLLFLAEVHYHKEDVIPSEHKFAHELTSSFLDEMFGKIRSLTTEDGYCVSFDACICHDKISFLKEILDNIACCRWDRMGVEDILKAQTIVHEFANAVNADILKNQEDRGHPHIYNACKFK